MAFKVNGVEVFGDDASIRKPAITQQRDGQVTDVTPADEVLVYDNENDDLMRVTLDELHETIRVNRIEPQTGAIEIGDPNGYVLRGVINGPDTRTEVQNLEVSGSTTYKQIDAATGTSLTSSGYEIATFRRRFIGARSNNPAIGLVEFVSVGIYSKLEVHVSIYSDADTQDSPTIDFATIYRFGGGTFASTRPLDEPAVDPIISSPSGLRAQFTTTANGIGVEVVGGSPSAVSGFINIIIHAYA